MRFVGRGSAAIRATHAKTIELSADAGITERATCVVAVATVEPPQRIAGPVRITITAGGTSFTLDALANPAWTPGGSAVIRRSGLRLPGTLATHADAAASDLPRDVVAQLQDPDAVVTVDVDPRPGPPTAVLFALDAQHPQDPRLAAELAAADVIVAEDDEAGRLLGERVTAGPVEVRGRVLVVATADLPGRTVRSALRTVDVETVGLPPALAAAAASPAAGPVLVTGAGDVRDVLRRAPAGTRIVLTVPADRVAATLRTAAELRGTSGAVAVRLYGLPERVDVGTAFPGAGPVALCLDPPIDESTALDPSVRAAIDGLLADGVATRAAARALATLTGWDRRRAYDAVVRWPT